MIGEEVELTEALNYLETVDFNYLVIPAIQEGEKEVVKTLYIGGGTPSSLDVLELNNSN